jgi:hypothetical protein
MQRTLTATQAYKDSLAWRAFYEGTGDPDMEELLAVLAHTPTSRIQERRCVCGALLAIDASGHIPEYCSEQCRQQAYRERNKARRYKAAGFQSRI